MITKYIAMAQNDSSIFFDFLLCRNCMEKTLNALTNNVKKKKNILNKNFTFTKISDFVLVVLRGVKVLTCDL